MNSRLLFVHALSPVHCGTGQSVGGIDLPIAREKPTDIPLIPGSSIKGVLRAMKPVATDKAHREAFGPDTENASENAGSVQFSDTNLVFLPVRSLRGTFAWVTSPYMLKRLDRDARACGWPLGALPTAPAESEARVTGDRLMIKDKGKDPNKDKVVFEDLDFTGKVDDALKKLAEAIAKIVFEPADQGFFVERVCLVNDELMALLLQTCTEITTRIKLDEGTKTVAKGQLWSEEALPIESLLAGLVVASPVKQYGEKGTTPRADDLFDHVAGLVHAGAVQLGGKATVGRGLCRMRLAQRAG